MRSLLVKGSDVWPLCFDFDAGATQQHALAVALRLSVPFVHEQQLFGEPERERPWLLAADMELP